jgi:hypothetical protein
VSYADVLLAVAVVVLLGASLVLSFFPATP